MHVWSCIEAPRSHAACLLHSDHCTSRVQQLNLQAAHTLHRGLQPRSWPERSAHAHVQCKAARIVHACTLALVCTCGPHIRTCTKNLVFCMQLAPCSHLHQCIGHALCVLHTDLKRRFCQIFPSVPRAAAATSAAIATRATVVFIVTGVCGAARLTMADLSLWRRMRCSNFSGQKTTPIF